MECENNTRPWADVMSDLDDSLSTDGGADNDVCEYLLRLFPSPGELWVRRRFSSMEAKKANAVPLCVGELPRILIDALLTVRAGRTAIYSQHMEGCGSYKCKLSVSHQLRDAESGHEGDYFGARVYHPEFFVDSAARDFSRADAGGVLRQGNPPGNPLHS